MQDLSIMLKDLVCKISMQNKEEYKFWTHFENGGFY